MLDPKTNESYYSIIKKICDLWLCNIMIVNQSKSGRQYYRVSATSRKSLIVIIDYFNKYPLLSSKFLDYKDWNKAANLILTNKHLTEEGIIEIENIRNTMNRNRTKFSWDHLDQLYLK